MLDTLRNAAKSWVAKALLVLLVLSFGVWGISGQMLAGGSGNTVARVGGTTVSTTDYRLAWNRQVAQISQQIGQPLTREQSRAFGIDDQVLTQLVAGAVLDEQGRALRLGVSQDRIAQLTVEDPSFLGADGSFERGRFTYVLQQVGMREEDYFRNQEQAAVREQIVQAVADGIAPPDTFLRAAALYRGEDRTVEYLVLPQSLVEPLPEPTPEELAQFFEARKATYAAPEYRAFSYVRLNPEDIADEAAISDEDVRRDFDSNRARFTTPERRAIEQIVFPTPEAAQAADAAIRAGTSTFEQVVAAQNKTLADVSLGTVARDQVSDPAVAEAGFGLAQGAVSPVVQGAFGPVILRVTAITPEVVQSFEQAAPAIRRDLALAEANRVLLDVNDSYEDARAGGASLAEAASRLNLPVRTVEAMDRSGQRPDGTAVEDLPRARDLVSSIFEAEPNTENQAVTTADGGYVFYEVSAVTPARDRTLEEVRDRVVTDWKAEEAQTRLGTRTEELRKRLADGSATLDAIATELGLAKQTKRGLRRGADDGDFGQAGVAAVFGLPEGGAGSAPAPQEGSRLLFRVTESFEPAASGPEAIPEQERTQFGQSIGNDILGQLIAQIQARYDVEVNRDTATRALAN